MLADEDCVAVNQDSSANIGKKVAYTLLKRPDLELGAGPYSQQA